ncbi:MAG: hypothetical protein ACLFVJ_18850 [Persicimonas sp.]
MANANLHTTHQQSKSVHPLRTDLVHLVQQLSRRADGVYLLEADGVGRAGLVFERADESTRVCRLRLTDRDFWTTPQVRATHRPAIEALEDLGWAQIVVGRMDEPTCPTCNGRRSVVEVTVDLIDGACIFTPVDDVLHICPTCSGQGVLR